MALPIHEKSGMANATPAIPLLLPLAIILYKLQETQTMNKIGTQILKGTIPSSMVHGHVHACIHTSVLMTCANIQSYYVYRLFVPVVLLQLSGV